jgi:hypothetical protein
MRFIFEDSLTKKAQKKVFIENGKKYIIINGKEYIIVEGGKPIENCAE